VFIFVLLQPKMHIFKLETATCVKNKKIQQLTFMYISVELIGYIGVFLYSTELLDWDVYFGMNESVGNCACCFILQEC